MAFFVGPDKTWYVRAGQNCGKLFCVNTNVRCPEGRDEKCHPLEPTEFEVNSILNNNDKLVTIRSRLSDISWYGLRPPSRLAKGRKDRTMPLHFQYSGQWIEGAECSSPSQNTHVSGPDCAATVTVLRFSYTSLVRVYRTDLGGLLLRCHDPANEHGGAAFLRRAGDVMSLLNPLPSNQGMDIPRSPEPSIHAARRR